MEYLVGTHADTGKTCKINLFGQRHLTVWSDSMGGFNGDDMLVYFPVLSHCPSSQVLCSAPAAGFVFLVPAQLCVFCVLKGLQH